MTSSQEYYHHPHNYGNPSSYTNTYEQDHDPVVPGGVPQWDTGVDLTERAMPNVSLVALPLPT